VMTRRTGIEAGFARVGRKQAGDFQPRAIIIIRRSRAEFDQV
jgi:hypothetical protein